MANLYAEHAREILGFGPDWRISRFKTIGWEKLGFDHPDVRIQITGAVAPMLSDGRIAWEYENKSTRRSVTITHAEHAAWVKGWETRTGNCSQCSTKFPGQEYVGWNCLTGTAYRSCPRCNGTGKISGVLADSQKLEVTA